MTDIKLWPSEAKCGYDHPVRRLVRPSTEEVLYFNKDQQRLTQEQLRGMVDPVRVMGSFAIRQNKERDKWEEGNLRAMGIDPEDQSEALEGYKLAGDPERLAEYIEWFIEYTNQLPAIDTQELHVIDSSGALTSENLLGQIKGYTLAIGTAVQLGDWSRSDELDRRLETAIASLRAKGYDIVDLKRAPTGDELRRHRLKLVTDDETGEFSVLVKRERHRADILPGIRIVKRSETVLPFHMLSPEAARTIMKQALSRPTFIETGISESIKPERIAEELELKEEEHLQGLIENYEEAIHRHEKTDRMPEEEMPMSPLSLTYLISNPKRQDKL